MICPVDAVFAHQIKHQIGAAPIFVPFGAVLNGDGNIAAIVGNDEVGIGPVFGRLYIADSEAIQRSQIEGAICIGDSEVTDEGFLARLGSAVEVSIEHFYSHGDLVDHAVGVFIANVRTAEA